ncbi:PAS domain-containing hybrid sensor histidine kinase/response regulator [Nocardioides aquiterrae]
MVDFREVFNGLPSATALVRSHSRGASTVVAVNPAFVRLTGRPETAIVGADLAMVLPGVKTRQVSSGQDPPRERGQAWFIDATGRRTPVSYEIAHEPAADDLMIVQVREIDASAQNDSAVRASEKLLEDVADNVGALIYLKRADGRYLFANRHYEELLRQPRGVIVGKTDADLWPKDIADVYAANDRAVFAVGHPMEFEEPIPIEDGWGMWLSLKFPIFDGDGAVYGVGGISTDISARARAQAAIREARDEAERANRAKDEFLSRMSHELRTPLNSILGFGQLLQLEDLPPSAGADVDHIVKAGRHLLALINEVLDISRVESGTQALAIERQCVCDSIGEAYEMVRPLAADRGVELVMDLHDSLERYVMADRQRLTQVMLNLLVNAVKYNRPDGVVTVTTEMEDEGHLSILVTDTGVGIAREDLERVFLPFERVGGPDVETEGTGLGLAVARSLVSAMGGGIGIKRSLPGRGTEFFVRLPLSSAPDLEEVAARKLGRGTGQRDTDLTGRTILYMEDNLANLELVRRILDRNGAPHLITATHGQLGLQLAAAHRPDLILLDLHLPDLDGSEVLTRLRADERTRPIPVVVLSADATTARRKQLLASGAVDYVTKPIAVEGLLEAVHRSISVGGRR